MLKRNLLPSSEKPLFNLLSIGQRAVGKTVFIAGSYAELNSQSPPEQIHSFWFEGMNSHSQENLNSILNYVAKTGKYPPSTFKISDFYLSLKQRQRRGIETVCNLHWWDIPGEYCDFEHPEFQKMVFSSHSCCVFINAERLVRDSTYQDTLGPVVEQVIAIANLVGTKDSSYAFALILTQCDRLGNELLSRLQIEKKLQFLIAPLEAVKANYRRFYSAIPLVGESSKFKLAPSGAADAFLWLVSGLNKKGKSSLGNSLATLLKRKEQPIQSFRSRFTVWHILASLTLLGAIATVLFSFSHWLPNTSPEKAGSDEQILHHYQSLIKRNPNDLETLVMLANLYLIRGQYVQVLPVIKKIVEQQPENLDWQLELANVYKLMEQEGQAEQVYNRILAQDEKHFESLLGKARLLREQGDVKTAKIFFERAEQAASSKVLKTEVRKEMSQIKSAHRK